MKVPNTSQPRNNPQNDEKGSPRKVNAVVKAAWLTKWLGKEWRERLYELALLSIFLAAGVARLHGFDRPLADWHSFRQTDTASVTREFLKQGIDPLRPRYQDVSNIASGKDNPEGWRMVEFPLLNLVVAGLIRLNPELPLVQTHRAVSIVASLISLSCIAWLMREWYGRTAALIAAGVFGFMPFSLYFTRVVLPEPFMVMLALLSLVFWSCWAKATAQAYDRRQNAWLRWADLWLLASGVFFAASLLVKPVAIFFILLFAVAAWRHRRWSWVPFVKGLGILAVTVLPLIWWRHWILNFPEGIPASDWLLNGNKIRFKPAWWRWLFGDRFGRLMFGHWGASTLILGGVAALWNFPSVAGKGKVWWRWLLESCDSLLQQEGLTLAAGAMILSFFSIFATGNVQHDYYQTLILPAVAMVSARGLIWLWRQARNLWQQAVMVVAGAVLAGFSFAFAWYDVEAFFSIQNPAIEAAGAAVQRLTPPDSLVIAHFMGDTTLLFATDRRGWPIGYSVEEKRAMGAEFFVSTAQDDETNDMMEQYPVIEKTDLYILIDLRTPLSSTQSAAVRP